MISKGLNLRNLLCIKSAFMMHIICVDFSFLAVCLSSKFFSFQALNNLALFSYTEKLADLIEKAI